MAELLPFPEVLDPPAEVLRSRPAASPRPHELSDARARAAALDIERSCIVEAPAGSGKTGLLIQRFLKLLAFADIQRPEQVLAITFTRKAAAELRSRVLDRLTEAAEAQPSPPSANDFDRNTRELAKGVLERDRAYGWRLLANPSRLKIRTIDAFCAELVRGLPLVTSGGSRRVPIDDARPLYHLAAERTLRELGGRDQELSKAISELLLHRDAQIGDCTRLLADMLAQRDQWGELIPLDPAELTEDKLNGEVRGKLERTLTAIVCRGLTRAADALGPLLLQELASFAARSSLHPGYNGKPSPLTLCAQRATAPGASPLELEHWRALLHLLLTQAGSWRAGFAKNHLGVELPKAELQWLKSFLEKLRSQEESNPHLRRALCAVRGLPPVEYPEAQWQLVKSLFRVLGRALVELQVLFEERTTCDFTDIALSARALLREQASGSSGADFSEVQIDHLLVDEMQDTSAGQYDLLESLTRAWDGRAQTLFLVGDPKQSIYMFRQARVERFLHTFAQARFGFIPLTPLRLTANFRSQAELVTAFNHTFEAILPTATDAPADPSAPFSVPYTPATATRAPGQAPALHWHLQTAPSSPPNAEAEGDDAEDIPAPSAAEDAQTIRRLIEQFQQDWTLRQAQGLVPSRPPKIAVLARTRTHFAPILEEFHRDRGFGPMPFRAVEIEVLRERQEVLDLLALTRALLHPGDRIAWLSVLRSPVCGLSLADLLALTGEGEGADRAATVPHLVATRAQYLSPEGQKLLSMAWPLLAQALAGQGRTSLSTHVERTWRSLGADAWLSPLARRNARRYLDLLGTLEDGSEPVSIPLLDRRLADLYAEPSTEAEAVELMTIHKAKGLEWDIVLIPSLDRGSGRSEHELLKWLELENGNEQGSEIVLAPIHEKGDEAHPLSAWLSAQQRQREMEECKRLFYVACTRAREQLHLFAAVKVRKDATPAAPRYDSLLKAAWPAAAKHLASPPAVTDSTKLRPFPVPLRQQQVPASGLAIAAAADESDSEPTPRLAMVHRLPADFDPRARLGSLRPAAGPLPPPDRSTGAQPISWEPTSSGPAAAITLRHFLHLLRTRLQRGTSAEALLCELPNWSPRLHLSLRHTGLSLAEAQEQTEPVLVALRRVLQDPVSLWLLSAGAGAPVMPTLSMLAQDDFHKPGATYPDQLFLAGSVPVLSGFNDHLWLVHYNFSVTEEKDLHSFLANERTNCQARAQSYFQAHLGQVGHSKRIIAALYHPWLARLDFWPAREEHRRL